MRNKTGTLFMFLGVVLLGTALSLFVKNQWEDWNVGQRAEEIVEELEQEIQSSQEIPAYDFEMTAVEIDGYDYIGYLFIEKLDLKLPVMSQGSEKELEIAPCRYSGSTKSDDIVIMGHNYARHFGRLEQLSLGDEVLFVDTNGVLSRYAIVSVENLDPLQVDEMTAGEYDMTLFTCTYSGRQRETYRCERVKE